MLHPPDCPRWEYKDDSRHKDVLKTAYVGFLLRLAVGHIRAPDDVVDTRPTHRLFFQQLAPPRTPYYAGNYRGANFRCLRCNGVKVEADRRVGYVPHIVQDCIRQLGVEIAGAIDSLDRSRSIVTAPVHVSNAVKLVCSLLNQFFLIHPYVNGNGHVGRALAWTILSRYSYRPKRLHINQSPSYSHLLTAYRNGQTEPLERFMLSCMAP